MSLKPETRNQQATLVDYCRTDRLGKLEGLTDGRVQHYRRLVYSVVTDALSNTYPLTRNLLTTKEWEGLCERFFSQHTCMHPQVWRMPEELIDYCRAHERDLLHSYPQLDDLFILEWKEVEYYMMPDRPTPVVSEMHSMLDRWTLNPESEILHFFYPVHLKNARYISASDAGAYHCLVFREPTAGKVRFMNLSPFTAAFLEPLLTNPEETPRSIRPSLQEEFGDIDEQVFEKQLEPFYLKLKEKGMVISN